MVILKRLLFSCLVPFLVVFHTAVFGQNYKQAVKLNPFSPISSQFRVAYEREMKEFLSVQIEGGVVSRGYNFVDNETYDYRKMGFVFIPEARRYMNASLNGAYTGAFVKVVYEKFTAKDLFPQDGGDFSSFRHYWNTGIGGMMGYQTVTKSGFLIDMYAGPQYVMRWSTSSENIDGLFEEQSGSGLRVKIGLNLGVGF